MKQLCLSAIEKHETGPAEEIRPICGQGGLPVQKKSAPGIGADGICSFAEVLVVEDVVLAEAVIAGTAGAVPELQVGVVGVGAAADLAFVAVTLFRFLFQLLADGGFEVDGLMGGLVPGSSPAVGDLVGNVGPEEHEEIQKSHHRQQRTQEIQLDQVLDHNDGKDHAVQQGQPI